MAQDTQHDVVIVGGGAAGLTAGLFAARRNHEVLILSQDIGGQAATTPDIENYPGVDLIDGLELMKKFKAQAERYGAKFQYDTVTAVEPQGDGTHVVVTPSQRIATRTVILAFGLSHRHLGIPGEEQYNGKGVSYCSICEPSFYAGKDIAVVGGGNSAVQAALMLAPNAKHVTLVNLNPTFNAEAVVLQRVQDAKNITPLTNVESKEVVGDGKAVTGLRVLRKDTGAEDVIPLERIFVEIGYVAKADWVKGILDTDPRGQIKISPNCETSVPGIFAAGDITTITFKQVVISAGEGAKAALEADQYLLKITGKRGARIDWGAKKK